MKKIILIMLLSYSISYSQDYNTNESELKQRKKSANQKIIAGSIIIGMSYIAVSSTDDLSEKGKQIVDRGAGVAAGVGGAIAVDGLIERIEISKEEKGRKKAKNNKQK